MLEPYWGEFLVFPVPLELSLFKCSNACAFCFATHGKPDRQPDVRVLMRLLADYPRRHTLTAQLLQAGYPVCVSNKTDPFSKSNYRQSLAFLRVMRELGIPAQLQTRGGHGMDEALDFLAPSVWYISIGTLDEALRQRLEPGAPPIAERFAFMARLRAAGHRVVVGYNPCVPEWCAVPRELLARAQGAGAEGAWIEPLHLNSVQEDNLLPREREALTEPLIRRARRRVRAQEDFAHVMAAREAAESLGLSVFTGGQPTRSDFWQPWRETYARTFPTVQDWVNELHDTGRDGTLVTYEEFAGFCLPKLPGVKRMDGSKYLMTSTSNHVWNRHPEWGAGMGYAEVLQAFWCEPRVKLSPVCLPCFAYAGVREGDGWAHVCSDDGMPLLAFLPGGAGGYWTEV